MNAIDTKGIDARFDDEWIRLAWIKLMDDLGEKLTETNPALAAAAAARNTNSAAYNSKLHLIKTSAVIAIPALAMDNTQSC